MKKLFTSDKFFLATVLINVLSAVIFFICRILIEGAVQTDCVTLLLAALCVLFLYSSYKKHSKNVMKGLMGAILMTGVLHTISLASSFLLTIDKIITPIVVVLSVALFINHFIINSDHHSSPAMVRLNQIICVLLAIAFFVWDLFWAFTYGDVLVAVASIVLALGEFGRYAAVVCVESRLDAYRIEREANGYKAE